MRAAFVGWNGMYCPDASQPSFAVSATAFIFREHSDRQTQTAIESAYRQQTVASVREATDEPRPSSGAKRVGTEAMNATRRLDRGKSTVERYR